MADYSVHSGNVGTHSGQETLDLRTKLLSFSWAHVVVLSVLLVTVLVGAGVMMQDTARTASLILLAVGTGLAGTVAFNILESKFSRSNFLDLVHDHEQEVLRELRRLQETYDSCISGRMIGLVQVFEWDKSDACRVEINKLLLDSNDLRIVLNYSNRWLEDHADALEARFRDPRRHTTFLFMHPESIAFDLLATKQDVTRTELEMKLVRACEKLLSLAGASSSDRVALKGHSLFNTHHAAVGDKQAYVTPAFCAGGKKVVPSFWFRKTAHESDYFKLLTADTDALSVSARDLRPWLEERRSFSQT